MSAAPIIRLEAPMTERVRQLMGEYTHWLDQPDRLVARLETLVGIHSRDKVARWQFMARTRQWPRLVASLLDDHYDPSYRKCPLFRHPTHVIHHPLISESAFRDPPGG
jgi:tRNA 2-selenouridine synthase